MLLCFYCVGALRIELEEPLDLSCINHLADHKLVLCLLVLM